MIALLDVESRKILLYSKEGLSEIPFSNVDTIREYLTEEKILYITKAIEVDATDIITLIYNIEGSLPPKKILEEEKNLYIHTPFEGTLFISEKLKFEGKYDIKAFDEEMEEEIENSSLLKKLKKLGKIELIGEQTRRKLMKEKREKRNEQKEKQKKADKQLDKILLEKSAVQAAEEGISDGDDDDDVMLIDLTNEREGTKVVTEAEENIRRLKIKE
jgi:hypothetical protein